MSTTLNKNIHSSKVYGFYKGDNLEYVGTIREYCAIYNVTYNAVQKRLMFQKEYGEDKDGYYMCYIGLLDEYLDNEE